jgi:hypothetical protein
MVTCRRKNPYFRRFGATRRADDRSGRVFALKVDVEFRTRPRDDWDDRPQGMSTKATNILVFSAGIRRREAPADGSPPRWPTRQSAG